jgi:succinoglycan biosynthesis protein ExoL
MLRAGSSDVILIGFRRHVRAVTEVEGCRTIDLGQTSDGAFLARIASVASVLIRMKQFAHLLADSDVIIARNLEMLVLAVSAARRYARGAGVVFECLDIHRLLLSEKPPGAFLRSIETRLMRHVDLILTSSPRFVIEYFDKRGFNKPIKVLENKILAPDAAIARPAVSRGEGAPPWIIGWFGMLRCRRSFEILSDLARSSEGRVQVHLAGRPSPKEFPDFAERVKDSPHVTFLGEYRFEDLQSLYAGVHFSWAIDYFEEGQNSKWLLPNRIYESSFFGAVPIALAEVETGRWLSNRSAGMVLSDEPENVLGSLLVELTRSQYDQMTDALGRISTHDLVDTRDDCRALVDTLSSLKTSGGIPYHAAEAGQVKARS